MYLKKNLYNQFDTFWVSKTCWIYTIVKSIIDVTKVL